MQIPTANNDVRLQINAEGNGSLFLFNCTPKRFQSSVDCDAVNAQGLKIWDRSKEQNGAGILITHANPQPPEFWALLADWLMPQLNK